MNLRSTLFVLLSATTLNASANINESIYTRSEPSKVVTEPTHPVSSGLIDFNGEYKQGGRIDLHWVSSALKPALRYEVERSLDGSHWDLAGSVSASTASGETVEYIFSDRVNKNTANRKDILYRLKEVQAPAVSITSKLLMMRVYNSAAVQMVAVSPNPAKNDINVTLQLNQPAVTSMKIVSTGGDEVFRKVVKTTEGLNNVLLEGTSKLQPGMYMLEVIINGKDRMIVQLLKD